MFTCWLKKNNSKYCASQAIEHEGPQLARGDSGLCLVWLNDLDEASLIGVPACGDQTPTCTRQAALYAISVARVRK